MHGTLGICFHFCFKGPINQLFEFQWKACEMGGVFLIAEFFFLDCLKQTRPKSLQCAYSYQIHKKMHGNTFFTSESPVDKMCIPHFFRKEI